VVVLPQGKFRKFLSAGSTEREEILKVLFETGRYERLQKILKCQSGVEKPHRRRRLERRCIQHL
jgi:exonuclease SbcC